MLSQFLNTLTFVTGGHIYFRWSHLSQVVKLVTCVKSGHAGHMWSHLSHVVTLFICGHITGGHTCHIQKVSSLTDDDDETRLTYRPARPQVKIPVSCSYLQVVSFPWDVGGDLLAGREADEDALPIRRVGLLRLLDHRLYHDSPKSSIFYKIFCITEGFLSIGSWLYLNRIMNMLTC